MKSKLQSAMKDAMKAKDSLRLQTIRSLLSAIQYDINQVRNRAGLDDTEASTYEELLLAILHERRVELAFEGERWFDLLRYDLAIALIESINSTDQCPNTGPCDVVNMNPSIFDCPDYTYMSKPTCRAAT